MKKYLLFVFIIVLLPFAGNIQIHSQDKASGTVKSVEYPSPVYNLEHPPDTNYLDMGMCMQGDSLVLNFELLNTGIKEISLAYKDPSFSLWEYKGTLDFELLHDNLNKVGKLLNGDESFNLRIVYRTENSIKDPATKNKHALLKLGLFDSDSVPDINQLKESDLITSKWYVLKFRKTNKLLDGFENYKALDSVYVNPTDTLWYDWTVQNSSLRGLSVEKQDTNWLSVRQQEAVPEFFFDFYKSNINFPQNQKFQKTDWKIGYYPVNPGEDKIELNLSYKPDPINFPDSVDFVRDTIRGFGVIQNMANDPDCNIFIDSVYKDKLINGKDVVVLDMGKILRNTTEYSVICIRNKGNIPFRAKTIKLLNETDNLESETFKLHDIPFGYKDYIDSLLEINSTIVLIDSFRAEASGIYRARLVIESDIATRNIRGFPQEAREVVFLLKAEVVEPKIKLTTNTVDFGNIVLCPENPTIVLDSINIFNDGKAQLQVSKFRIEPDSSPFSVIPGNMEIPPGPNTYKTAYITFNTDRLEVNKEYTAKVFIENNSYAPNNVTEIYLTARCVESSATKIQISRELKAKPGRLISVPIIVDKAEISIARTFRDTLSFDGNLLAYDSFDKSATASVKALESDIIINENPHGVLPINIKLPEKIYFEPSDTLIVLIFRTYLGNKISTDITFRNPELGNGICARVLNTSNTNGYFSLDSVCGLEQKAVSHLAKNFSVMSIYPNPVKDNFDIKFRIKDNTVLDINVFDIYGQKIIQPASGKFQAGDYNYDINAAGMSAGLYYIELTDGYNYEIYRIVIAR